MAKAVDVVFPRTARRHITSQKVGNDLHGTRLTDNKPTAYAFFAGLGSNTNRV